MASDRNSIKQFMCYFKCKSAINITFGNWHKFYVYDYDCWPFIVFILYYRNAWRIFILVICMSEHTHHYHHHHTSPHTNTWVNHMHDMHFIIKEGIIYGVSFAEIYIVTFNKHISYTIYAQNVHIICPYQWNRLEFLWHT